MEMDFLTFLLLGGAILAACELIRWANRVNAQDKKNRGI